MNMFLGSNVSSRDRGVSLVTEHHGSLLVWVHLEPSVCRGDFQINVKSSSVDEEAKYS